jgi:hypothetical protein
MINGKNGCGQKRPLPISGLDFSILLEALCKTAENLKGDRSKFKACTSLWIFDFPLKHVYVVFSETSSAHSIMVYLLTSAFKFDVRIYQERARLALAAVGVEFRLYCRFVGSARCSVQRIVWREGRTALPPDSFSDERDTPKYTHRERAITTLLCA